MASEIESKIVEGLFEHLNDATFSPSMSIAWPGVNAPGSGAYLRPSILPATTFAFEVGYAGQNRHSGILQVDVFWPEDQGLVAPMEMVGQIVKRFKKSTVISRESVTIEIRKPPSIAAPLQEPGWLQIPVNIEYVAETPNP